MKNSLIKKFFSFSVILLVGVSLFGCKEIRTINILKEESQKEILVTDVAIGKTLDAEYANEFTVSNVFSNDMVVQRGEHIRVWGTAPESENGKKVSGEFKGMFAEALIDAGQWTLTFGARLEASCELGHTLKIYTDTKEVAFSDVLVGDVYMVIGQSNVSYSVGTHWSYVSDPSRRGERTVDENIPIRLHYNSLRQTINYPLRGTEEVCSQLMNKSIWMPVTLDSVTNFSALGYFFAESFIEITNGSVPVGIIEIDGNGQPLGAFMSNEVATLCKTDVYDDILGYYKTSGVNGDAGRYMYNHYMYPFEKYAIAGIVWYQGESDYSVDCAKVYAQNFSSLMTYMRGTHNLINKNFPVYIVEFPPIYKKPHGFVPTESAPRWASMDVGLIRAVLGSIPQYLANSHISVSCDLWDDHMFWNNLHPNCKFEQGQRVAQLVAANMGLIPVEQATGPILKSVKRSINGKEIILTYDNVGSGLMTSDGQDKVLGFGIVDKTFTIKGQDEVKIEATITASNQITIRASIKITGIAYNFISDNAYDYNINLCNSEGIPAGSVLFVY